MLRPPRAFLPAFLLGTVLPAGLLAQGCSTLSFTGDKDAILISGGNIAILARQADGSYSAVSAPVTPPYSVNAVYNNYQNSVLSGCPATPTGSTKFPPVLSLAPLQGVAGQLLVTADFQNNGTTSAVFAPLMGGVFFATFSPDIQVTPLPGTNVTTLGAGDFNHDGKYDFVEVFSAGQAPGSSGGVQVFLGNGDGTFTAGAVYQTGQNALMATVADLNGDGNLDLVVSGDGTSSVSVLLGKGDGTFAATTSPVAGRGPVGTVAADFNNDHKLDLATANEDGTVSIFLGHGDGTFDAAKSIPCGSGCTFPVAADFNGDGNLDLAVSSPGTGLIAVLLGKGDGGFQPAALYSGGMFPSSLVVTDFDHDGKPDILVADGNPDVLVANTGGANLDVLLGNGDGTFKGLHLLPAGSPKWVETADFNGDGKPDFAATSHLADGNVFVYLGQGDGKFQALAPFAMPSTNQGYSPDLVSFATGDFNGDGKADIAAVENFAQTLAVAYGAGDGTFQSPRAMAIGGGPVMAASADLNGDGKADIVVANTGAPAPGPDPGSIQVFLSNGAGFQGPTPFAAGSHPNYVAIADVNLDGKPDLVVTDLGTPGLASDPGGVSLLLGKGDGTFQAASFLSAGTYPASVSVGDVNRDGKPDLVVLTQHPVVSGAVAVFLGNGNGTFQPVRFLAASQTGANAVIQDFNGDKKPDLVLANCCGGSTMTYFLGNGDGSFQPEAPFAGGPAPVHAATADLNGDGKPDLVIANENGPIGGIAVLLNTTQSPSTQPFNNAEAAGGSTSVAQDSLVAAYANGSTTLATSRTTASTPDWPTTLAGTTVSVADSAGTTRPAQIYFVDQTQVDYAVPDGTAAGPATVTITTGNGVASSAPANIVAVSPGIFAVGPNLAAANVIRAVGSQQTVENDYSADSGGNVVARPIPLNPATDKVYLVLYASGVRNAALSSVTATAGGQPVPVFFVGAQQTYPGLDQVNIGPLPASLAGAGSVTIQVTAAGVAANPVQITVQ